MMRPLREYRPQDREHNAWVEDVRRVSKDLEGAEVSFQYLAARAPVSVAVPFSVRPTEVRVKNATNRSDKTNEGGMRIQWDWRGGEIRVLALDVIDTADEYEVTLIVRVV